MGKNTTLVVVGMLLLGLWSLLNAHSALGVAALSPSTGAAQVAATFCSQGGAVSIPGSGDSGQSAPYPSQISVTGLGNWVTDLNIELHDFQHQQPNQVDMVLVSPGGQSATFMSDTGGALPLLIPVTITLDDAEDTSLPQIGPLVPGASYSPFNYDTAPPDDFGLTPAPSSAAALTAFDGTNPNGTWKLYIVDDEDSATGTLGSWCLQITSSSGPTPTAFPTSSHTATVTHTSTPSATATATATTGPQRLYLPLVIKPLPPTPTPTPTPDPCRQGESEPNDTRADARTTGNLVCVNVPVTGQMATSADTRDVFIFNVTSPVKVDISVNPMPSDADFDVGLYAADNTRIGFSVNRGNGLPEFIPGSATGVLPPGEYAIMVYSHVGLSNQNYTLRVTPAP